MTNNNLTTSGNATCVSNNNSSNSSSGFNSAGSNQAGSFQFPFEDSKEKVQEQLQKMQQQQQQENNTSERLRNLLMKSPSAEDELRRNQILKVIKL